MSRFSHLQGANEFPGTDTVQPFMQYKSTFDYNRWQPGTQIKLMSVPFDDVTHAVRFDDEEARDAWFDAQEGFTDTLQSEFRIPFTEGVKLPLPYDEAIRCNMIMVTLPFATSEGMPLNYETAGGIRRYFYRLEACDYVAPSTTMCYLKLDHWQTFSYRCQVSQLMLRRGHAPMSAVDADAFLEDPIASNRYLLAPDASYGILSRAGSISAVSFQDGTVYAVIVTTATVTGNWGAAGNGWATPVANTSTAQGNQQPYSYIAMRASDLSSFVNAAYAQAPQIIGTVRGIFTARQELLSLSSIGTVFGVQCWACQGGTLSTPINLSKGMFGYDARYASFAKLYTYPYAALQIADGNGGSIEVHVEDIDTANWGIDSMANLSFPVVSIESYVRGVGGSSASVTFSNLTTRQLGLSGIWERYVLEQGIPLFALAQNGATHNHWSTYYDREQARISYTNAYDSAVASANTAQSNSNNSASTMVSNNAITVAASNATVANTNASNSTGVGYSNNKINSDTNADIATSSASLEAELASAAVASANNNAQAVASAANALTSTVGAAASGNIAGAVSSAIGGAVSTGVNWQCTNASINVSISNSQSIFDSTTRNARLKAQNSTGNNSLMTSLSNTTMAQNTATNNNAATSCTANSAGTTRTNAANSRNTAVANAGRSRDTAISAVSNQVAQRALDAPTISGAESDHGSAGTRPRMLTVTAVTQQTGAIEQAAAEFARYGYALGQQWDVEVSGWQLMGAFTYWEADDAIVTSDTGVLQGSRDAIKDMLTTGVTIWDDPSKVGKTSIWENA